MLKEAMRAYRVTDLEFAQQFADLLEAAYLDMTKAGVEIDGEVEPKRKTRRPAKSRSR